MKTTYATILKHLRDKKGLSQAEVAGYAHMSRASYVAVEKGTKELTLAEAVSLTKLFGITLDELVKTSVPDQDKYIEMIIQLLRLAKTSKKVLKKTKLSNLLYLADISWYYENKRSMSSMAYRKVGFGPVADEYFRILEELEVAGTINIKQIYRDDYHMYEIEETRPSARRGLKLLNQKEQKHIQKIWLQWEEASTAEITKFTIEQKPYQDAIDREHIDFKLILEEDSYNIY